MTPAELTKKDEFYSIYWKEYKAVKNGMNSELKELPDYLEKRPVFEDVYKRQIYGICFLFMYLLLRM